MKPMMKCGHAANSFISDDKPVCVICFGITPELSKASLTIDENATNLDGRIASCPYCGKRQTSSPNLAFFRSCPDKEFDEYYDGCFGWD